MDDKHKILYCPIPKVASSTFDAIIASAASGINLTKILSKAKGSEKHMSFIHSPKTLLKYSVQGLASYSQKKQRSILKNYFKFLVVRHPFDRLLSTYVDKVEYMKNISHAFPLFVQLAHNIRSAFNGSSKTFFKKTKDGKKVFLANKQEFFYLVANHYDSWFQDRHWGAFYDLCQPCVIHYDAVVRLETLNYDVSGILDRLQYGVRAKGKLPVTNTLRYKQGFNFYQKVNQAFRGIDSDIVRGLMRVYHKDFELYGYHWDIEKHVATCSYYQRGAHCC